MANLAAQLRHLQATMGKLDAALDAVDEAIVVTGEGGAIQWCNAPFTRLAGCGRLELLGVPLTKVLPLARQGQTLGPEAHPVALARQSPSPAAGIYEFQRGRQPLVLEIFGVFVGTSEAGKSAVLVIRDITERQRTEEKLYRLFSAIEQTADPVFITNRDGVIEYVNPAFEKLTGYSPEEAIGQTPRILKSGRHDEEFYKELWATLLSDRVFQTVFTNRKKNGELNFVEATITPIRDQQGQINHFISTEKDVTERIKLEKMVLQSEKMSAVGRLAAGVAHEINNPLGVILGFAQALARRLLPGDPQEMPMKSIEREAIRCKNLVQDLLTFSRTSRLDRGPIDLNQAVEGALSLVQAEARVKKTEVRKQFAANLPRLFGDSNQVQQVVINLANNALDAMPDGGMLTVRTELLEDGPRSWVCLKVADTGQGIPKEVLPKIFEPFFTTKPIGQGTGLGLSLVYEIVQKHSGSIEVQSRPGCTEFCVKFPVRTGQESADHPTAAIQPGISGPVPPPVARDGNADSRAA